MESIISVFRMTELSAETRALILIKLGGCINYSFASNVTEPLVIELIKALGMENSDNEQIKKYLETARTIQ